MTLSQAAMMVTAVFVTAPAPGMLVGIMVRRQDGWLH